MLAAVSHSTPKPAHQLPAPPKTIADPGRWRTFPGPSRMRFIWSLYRVSSASSLRTLTSMPSIRTSVDAMASDREGLGAERDEPKIRFCAVRSSQRVWEAQMAGLEVPSWRALALVGCYGSWPRPVTGASNEPHK